MIDVISQKINKTRMTLAIISLIIGAILLTITKMGIIDLISVPEKIDFTENFDISQYKGEYVELDIQYIVGVFCEEITQTKSYGITMDSRTTGYGILCYNEDFKYNGDYTDDYNNGEFYGVTFSKSEYGKIEHLFDETNVEEENPVPDNYTVKGTIKEMDAKTLDYFQQALAEMGADSYSTAYIIKTDNIKGFSPTWLITLTLISVLAFVVAIYNFIIVLTGKGTGAIKSYLKEHPFMSENELDEDFRNASIVAADYWISRERTYKIQGGAFEIIDNKNIIWAYHFYNTKGKNIESLIMLADNNKKFIKLSVSPSEATGVLNAYSRLCPNIYVGYSPQIDEMFKNDFDKFLMMVKEEEERKTEFEKYNQMPSEEKSFNNSFDNFISNPVNNTVNSDDPFELNPIDQDPYIQDDTKF